MAENVTSSLKPGETALLAVTDIPEGGFAEVEASIDGDHESLLLYRGAHGVRAWLNICPHAGRRLDWAPGKFLLSKEGLLVCAVHGASFELDRGLCVAGPCRGQSLCAVSIEERHGHVVLAGKPATA